MIRASAFGLRSVARVTCPFHHRHVITLKAASMTAKAQSAPPALEPDVFTMGPGTLRQVAGGELRMNCMSGLHGGAGGWGG